eukprot:12937730-Alexandrium_andersonii.AAC.1
MELRTHRSEVNRHILGGQRWRDDTSHRAEWRAVVLHGSAGHLHISTSRSRLARPSSSVAGPEHSEHYNSS